MKTQIKRLSKSTLAVILSVCLLFSCMTVGIIATDAAKVTESGAIGAKDDSESVGNTNRYLAGQYLYIDMASSNRTLHGVGLKYWDKNDEWKYKEISDSAVTALGNGVYRYDLSSYNSEGYSYFSIFRVGTRNANNDENSWKEQSITSDATTTNNKIIVSFSNDNLSLSWGTYTPPHTPKTVTFGVDSGTSSNGEALTAAIDGTAITSGQTHDYGSSVTFTATPNSGYKTKWYSDSACTTEINGASGDTYTANLTDNMTVYVKYVQTFITIYVCDNRPLTETADHLCFYTFHGTTTGGTGAWPGKKVATAQNSTYRVTTVGTIDSKTVYMLELDTDNYGNDTGIIIDADGNQTGDLTLSDGAIYFTKTENNIAGSQDIFDQSMLDNSNVKSYVIAGTKSLVGSDPWSTTAHRMKYNSNGTYTITFNNVAAAPEYGTLAFKVIEYNTDWVAADNTNSADNVTIENNVVQKKIDSEGNIAFTTGKKSNITITYNPNAATNSFVTISAADIPSTTLTTTIYVNKNNVNGLYVWTDTDAEPLGTWNATETNVSSVQTTETLDGYSGSAFVKHTFESSDSTFKYIVRKGSSQSSDSSSYPIGGTYVINTLTNVPDILGGGGGGNNSDSKWDPIFVDENKVPAQGSNKFLLKSNNQEPTAANFTSTNLDAYTSDGKIYFKIPYATISSYKYFMLAGTDNDYTSDWYQITNNSGNSITNVFVDNSASDYLSAAKKEYYGQEEGHRNTNYFYSQVTIQEGAENTFKYVVLEIDPAQSKRTFTYYTYGATPIAKKPKIVVENGSYGYQSKYGTATVTTPAGLTGTNGSWWTTYRVEEGTQLYVTTTIKSECRGNGSTTGMYVYAYAVNGVKYEVESNDGYTFVNTKPITVGTEDIEITPVYYSRSIENANDYISVYVEADSNLIDHWGDQIYVYSYYYGADPNSGTTEHEGRMDGNYPGQTLVLDGSGYYYGKIAKCFYSGNYLQTKDAAHPVSGVTFSGGYENNAPHHNFIDYAQNRQTYDYDDFKYIANLGYDTVRLDLKYEPQTSDSNQHMLINNATNQPSTDKTPASVDVSKVQGWEYLYDYDYNPCSVLGLSGKVARDFNETFHYANDGAYGYSGNQNVKIISVGNQHVENTGDWATYWYVYKNTGTEQSPVWTFVTKGLPSDFICRTDSSGTPYSFDDSTEGHQTDQWRAVYDAGIAFTAASIAYEAEMGAGTSVSTSNTGHRIDARWLYTTSQSRYEVHAGVAIYDASTGNYTLDTNNFGAASPTGTAKASAYIDNSTNHNRNDNVSSKKFDKRNVDAYLTTNSPSSDYYFAYWAVVKGSQPDDANLSSGGNMLLSDVERLAGGEEATHKILANTNQFFVAVYKPITGGKLILKHDAYTDGGLTGTGNRYIQADIVQSDGTTVVSSFKKSKDQITVTGITNQMSDRGYLLRIKLYTASLDSSVFNKFWLPGSNAVVSTNPAYSQAASANSKDGKVCTEDDPAAYTLTVAVSDIYSAITASEAQNANVNDYTINYKSDLDTGYKYEIKYTYNSRFWNSQTYTVKGTFTTEEFNTYVTDNAGTLSFNSALKEDFLAVHSPYEDNFKETVKWKFSLAKNLVYNSTTKTFTTSVASDEQSDRTINIKFIFPFAYNDSTRTAEGSGRIGETVSGHIVGLVPTKDQNEGNRIMKIDTENNIDFTDTLQYLDWYSLNACKNSHDQEDEQKPDEPFLLETPGKIYTKDVVAQGAEQTYTEYTFQYWSLKTYPTDDSVSAVEYKRCYSRHFNLGLYQSTIAEPIYKVVTAQDPQVTPSGGESATINFLENSRNQWNYDGGGEVGTKVKDSWMNRGDRIFSDFVISFEYNGKLLKAQNDNNYKAGVVLESVGTLQSDAYGDVTIKTPEEYKTQYEPDADATEAAKTAAVTEIKKLTNAQLQNSEVNKTGTDCSYLFAGVSNIANLDNKNSIEFAYSFANISHTTGSSDDPTPTLRKNKIYRAFSYVYDRELDKVVISDPIYFTIYDIASIQSGDAYTES